ncbi:hypothetical protein KM043_012247 [Ampulex compressa]|nr:hypothetical protein KM043_012247 [Ampulex compressa]
MRNRCVALQYAENIKKVKQPVESGTVVYVTKQKVELRVNDEKVVRTTDGGGSDVNFDGPFVSAMPVPHRSNPDKCIGIVRSKKDQRSTLRISVPNHDRLACRF